MADILDFIKKQEEGACPRCGGDHLLISCSEVKSIEFEFDDMGSWVSVEFFEQNFEDLEKWLDLEKKLDG